MRPRRSFFACLMVATVLALAACEDQRNWTAPSPPSPTVTSVTVTTVQVGALFQCSAVAGFSDGSTQNITNEAAWTSLNPSVATVNSLGLVSPVGDGSTEIVAAYRGTTGVLRLVVVRTGPSPSTNYTLSGTVRENSSVGKAVSAARIEIAGASNEGKFTNSDDNGQYVLPGLAPGRLTFKVTRSGYREFHRDIDLTGDLTVDAPLDLIEPVPSNTYVVSGVVRATPLNEVVADARVEVTRGGSVEKTTTSDSNGLYSVSGLVPQQYVVRATKTGYSVSSKDVMVTADTRQDIVLDRNRVTLEGFVRRADPCIGSLEAARAEILDGPDAGKYGLTAFAVRYRIDSVVWGSFRMRASKPGYSVVEGPVTIPAAAAATPGATVMQDFSVVDQTGKYALSGEIRNRMVDTAGQINGALIEITHGPNTGKSVTSGGAGLGNGTYRFTNLLEGIVYIKVSYPDFVNEYHNEFQLCADARIDVRITPTTATLAGVVRDESSSPLAGATVEMISTGSGVPLGKSAVTDANGQYALSGIYGTFAVRVSKVGYVSEARTLTAGPNLAGNFTLKKSP